MVSTLRTTLIAAAAMGVSALASLMSACSAPDPAALTVRDPIAQNGSSSGGSGSSSSTSSSGASGGFFPAAFVAGNPGLETNAIQGHGIGVSHFGADCSSCHTTGGAAAGKIFKAAGSVYDGANPAVNAEVLIKGATPAQQCSTYTDASGNFWCEVDFGTTATVGVRTATRESKMQTPITSGACATAACHSTTNKVDFQ